MSLTKTTYMKVRSFGQQSLTWPLALTAVAFFCFPSTSKWRIFKKTLHFFFFNKNRPRGEVVAWLGRIGLAQTANCELATFFKIFFFFLAGWFGLSGRHDQTRFKCAFFAQIGEFERRKCFVCTIFILLLHYAVFFAVCNWFLSK